MSRPLPSLAPKTPGSPPSFEELYERYAEQVYVWAMRYARGRSAWAQDVTHDVFIQAWEHRSSLREADLRAWLFRVTQNHIFTLLRREQSFVARFQRAIEEVLSPPSPDRPDEQMDRRERIEIATRVLDRLPAAERMTFALKELDGLSQREIAELLGLSEGYVSKLLARARVQLERMGKELGHDRA